MDLSPSNCLMRDIDQIIDLNMEIKSLGLKTSLLKNLVILPCTFVSPGLDNISSHMLSRATVLPVNKILAFFPCIKIQL